MKKFFTCLKGVIALCLVQTMLGSVSNAQSLTARANVFVDTYCNGFWEYLPAGYNTSQKYPLIIALGGVGEMGSGSSTDLQVMLYSGIPYTIKNGKFPSSTTVNGKTYQFVVIAPQVSTNPNEFTLDNIYKYCLQHYSVDPDRVYMTGYSQGGGNIAWYVSANSIFAQNIAALLPIAVSVTLSPTQTQTIASSNLPVLATDNSGDSWFTTNTINNVNQINSSTPAPTPLAAYYLFNASGHGGWNETYDPTVFTYNGLNAYQWMLQYQRSAAALPVVMGAYTAQLTGPSTVAVNWTTTSELNNKQFILQRSSDGIAFSAIDTIAATNYANGASYTSVDNHPLSGNNFYRLVQVDIDGKTTYFNVLKVTVTLTVQTGLKISPNPVSSTTLQLQLSHPETGDLQVVLSDMQGRVLRNWKFSKPGIYWQQTLDLGNIPAGNYTLQLRGTTLRETQQFVKQ